MNDYVAFIVTVLLSAATAVLLGTAPRWAWLVVVLDIIVFTSLVFQRRPNGDSDICNAYVCIHGVDF